MSEPWEEDRRRLVSELRRSGAPSNVGDLLVGILAGPATEDRPAVPAWEYPAYQRARPEISTDELVAARTPIRLFPGEETIFSIAELLSLAPSESPYQIDFLDVIRLMELRHEFGGLEWDEVQRGYVETMPLADYRDAVYGQWRRELRAKKPRR